jgi:uncharacterized protein (TIGR03118 family)
MRFARLIRSVFVATQVGLGLTLISSGAAAQYVQTNLVSNGAVPALATDANLVNPWGLASLSGSPFWVSDQATGESTLYSGSGAIESLVVTVPGAGPTGIVANGGSGFGIAAAAGGTVPAKFIFATLDGSIYGWNPGSTSGATKAVPAATVPGASFTGLAIAGSNLYAADFAGGKIDAFNSTFGAILPGAFVDPNLPAGDMPYNIQNIGGKLYVEYCQSSAGVPLFVPGDGAVDVYDANGIFIQRLITGSDLDVPWGITMAPAGFGPFGGDLLVGNLGSGEIDAFDPVNGTFRGTLDGPGGTPLTNGDLWGLQFGTGGKSGGDPDTLFFTAGVDDYSGGLFGSIQAVPEPSCPVMALSAAAGFAGAVRRRRHEMRRFSWGRRTEVLR